MNKIKNQLNPDQQNQSNQNWIKGIRIDGTVEYEWKPNQRNRNKRNKSETNESASREWTELEVKESYRIS